MARLTGQTEPRIYTPPLRELTPETSDGFACIKFAEDMLHMSLFPWQKWLLIHALELAPDGTYRFRTVIVMVARQNGKTMVEIVLALWHMYCVKSRRIIGTAQSLEKAEDAWQEAVERALEDEELSELIPDDGVYRGHPKSFTVVHDDAKCEYRIAAATRKGGRGFSGDLILLDELREHQNWDSWSSVTNTMNARPWGQAWAFSNAGDALSVVLRYQRALAHRDLGWPDGDEDVQGPLIEELEEDAFADLDVDELPYETGFFEWSMPVGVSRTDREWLAVANPSMNHTEVVPNCITLKALLHGLRSAPAAEAETEICCRFTVLGTGGPFAEGGWEDTLTDLVEIAPAMSAVCVEVSQKRERTFIARAGTYEVIDKDAEDANTVVLLGMWQDRPGTDWVVEWLQQNRAAYDAVIVRSVSGAPVMSIYDDLVDADLPVIDWNGPDISAATGKVHDLVRDRGIKHLPHAGMDLAATSAATRKETQGGFVIDIAKSPSDPMPLMAGIGAVWGVDKLADMVSVYADDDVLVL